VDLLADYTTAASEISRALNKATSTTGRHAFRHRQRQPARTLLYGRGVPGGTKTCAWRRAQDLVLLDDGGDQGSQETLKTADDQAGRRNGCVCDIDRRPADSMGAELQPGDFARADGKARQPTPESVINVGHDGQKLEDAFNLIQDELRTQ